MKKLHTHNFVEEYNGLIGFGMDRKTNESTLTYYLQKFSDDEFIALIRSRMSDEELVQIFDLIGLLMKNHLTEEEYHKYFLKDNNP